MHTIPAITCLFVDIGGVLLSDGWDLGARRRAARHFGLTFADLEHRHHQAFDAFECGKMSLDEYLGMVVFDQARPFTRVAFRRFMFDQSKPHPGMISLITRLKARHGLKITILSNEARELNAYRVAKYKLQGLADSFISSCFVHLRKPDTDIFRLALDVSQTPAPQVVFIENTPMFVDIARGLGMHAILHVDCLSTRARLAALGLSDEAEGPDES